MSRMRGALDVPTLTVRGASRVALDRALGAHTLATARLTARYERPASKTRAP